MVASVHILFRFNAGVSLGLGHLSRCRSLMLALSRQAECRFSVVANSAEVVRAALAVIPCDVHDVGAALPSRFDAAIIDLPESTGEDFRRQTDLLVCIDDTGPGVPGQDILIRPNLLGLPRPADMPDDRYWPGLVILHPDFALQAATALPKAAGRSEVFVCFGGSDPGNITVRVVPVLRELGADMRFRIILGAAFPWDEQLLPLLGRDGRFVIERNIPDVARALRSADLALISGGTLLFESCASGVPAVVVCQNEEQRVEADTAQAAGAVLCLGLNAQVCDRDILAAVERLLRDTPLRRTMADRGRALVPADGAAKLAAKLLSAMTKRNER
jgi:spore coat polysaccharide biosynthesis predicted glycosyltransferase SpsG